MPDEIGDADVLELPEGFVSPFDPPPLSDADALEVFLLAADRLAAGKGEDEELPQEQWDRLHGTLNAWLDGEVEEFEEGPDQTGPNRTKPEPAPQPAKSGDIALAGPDGTKARDLLRQAKEEGQRLLSEMVGRAVARLDPSQLKTTRRLFTPQELAELTNLLHTIHTTAELLGRASVRLRARQAKFRDTAARFSDTPTDFTPFADTIPLPPTPQAALDYFKRLVPGLTAQAKAQTPRKTFSVFALDADSRLLGLVKSVITEALEGKQAKPETAVSDLLQGKESRLRIGRDAYAEMVVRTNMMGAYTQGVTDEMQDENMKSIFPVWRYLGIRDGRQGKDHEPHFDKYYPSSKTFDEVRGKRVFSCRCCPAPIDAAEWVELQKRGARLSR